jgi:hypothetical protein
MNSKVAGSQAAGNEIEIRFSRTWHARAPKLLQCMRRWWVGVADVWALSGSYLEFCGPGAKHKMRPPISRQIK